MFVSLWVREFGRLGGENGNGNKIPAAVPIERLQVAGWVARVLTVIRSQLWALLKDCIHRFLRLSRTFTPHSLHTSHIPLFPAGEFVGL